MAIVFALLILVTAGGLGLAYYRRLNKPLEAEYFYRKKKPLSDAEEQLYWKLVRALPEHVILPKVAMTRILSSSGQAARSLISSKNVDFLVCDRSFNIVAAIELESRSRSNQASSETEDVKTMALEKADVRYIVWKALALPSDADILQKILGVQQKPGKRQIVTLIDLHTEVAAR